MDKMKQSFTFTYRTRGLRRDHRVSEEFQILVPSIRLRKLETYYTVELGSSSASYLYLYFFDYAKVITTMSVLMFICCFSIRLSFILCIRVTDVARLLFSLLGRILEHRGTLWRVWQNMPCSGGVVFASSETPSEWEKEPSHRQRGENCMTCNNRCRGT